MAAASGFAPSDSGSWTGSSHPPAGSGPTGQSQAAVAVWEWQDDQGYWRPYSGQVSCYIEQCLLNQRGLRAAGHASTSISLGQVDPSLAPYIIDIPSLKQFRQDTGKIRAVRRSLFPQSSALGSGMYWEWANDEGGWTPYETRTLLLLEHSYQARQSTADLAPHGYNYMVDLRGLAQVNKGSGYRRQVRRCAGQPYPLATQSPGSVIHSGPACSCQQCLGAGGSSTGPIPSRSRHSFSAGQGHRNGPQGPVRVPAGGPPSMYSPYPRRPHSVGGTAWVGPWSPPVTSCQSSSSSATSLSVPSVPVQMNGSTSVSSALAGMASILMSAAGIGVRLTSAPLPPQQAPGRPAKVHADVRRAKRHRKELKPVDVIQKYMERVTVPPEEDCIICMERLSGPSGYDDAPDDQDIAPNSVGKFTKCGHSLHLLCMLAMYNNGTKDGSLQCPSCKTIYGEKTGTQPKGKMEIYSISQPLPGHPDCGTIQIIYSIPPGIQGPEHPNPGQPYTCRGFPRLCFLPDNGKGRKVLELLKVAWSRRLIFTVGTSSTTGEPDTVVWNEIHHKTEMMSNVSGHGYPDPNYLDNVLSELASQGVTEDCLKQGGLEQGS
ncbi:probable E3 ubiquitin-protein ligase DTX2 isoform X1 [Brienomyrus brachyistius]|uniref:probable E3 ubiquitin-protein ligase DTX2 isoform X1 n=1 Tax=Brienomyrus brachyistius TaxID=42636 RepID=UPI0020B2CB99|nr:probable E3 ubiquitin-protein ligase DTX2 isoform X1 [Brienomyrus brachyistius]